MKRNRKNSRSGPSETIEYRCSVGKTEAEKEKTYSSANLCGMPLRAGKTIPD
jgi:hypothetical protein